MANQDEEVNLNGQTGEIELPKIDITSYIGKTANIENVTTKKGIHGFYVYVETEIVDTITGGKEDILLRGSKILGLHEDKEGNIGWSKDTKCGKFLASMKVEHYDDLVGKEVILQSTEDRKYLTFS